MISIEIRSIKRIIEYDLGYLQIEVRALQTSTNTYIKRKNQEDYSFIKNIPNGLSNIMTIETLLNDILQQHALGNKINEHVEISLSGVYYDYFIFSMVCNGNMVNVRYSVGTHYVNKNILYYANYYDLNQLLYISNSLLSNYLRQQETLRKQKEKLIEKKQGSLSH